MLVSKYSPADSGSSASLGPHYAAIVEKQLRATEGDLVTLDAMDDFYKQAYTLISSPEARAAVSAASRRFSCRSLNA